MTRVRSVVTGGNRRSLAERIGYASDSKLLIVHADDLGLTRSVNDAFVAGLTAGCISSGSAMVPCPHFAEVVDFAGSRREADIGLHYTLTSGPVSHRWKPMAEVPGVRSLVDGEGYFQAAWTPIIQIDARHVEIDLSGPIQ